MIEVDVLWLRQEALKIDKALADPNLTKEQMITYLKQGEELLLRTANSLKGARKIVEHEN